MTEILIPTLAALMLLAGFAALVVFARRDNFTGPSANPDLKNLERPLHRTSAIELVRR